LLSGNHAATPTLAGWLSKASHRCKLSVLEIRWDGDGSISRLEAVLQQHSDKSL